MRKHHVLSLTVVLLAGLGLGTVDTASAAPKGHDNDRASSSYRYDNGRRDNRGHDHGRFENRDRNDRRFRYGRRHRHNNRTTVIIKRDRDRWNIGDALLYHLGRTVIDGVFDTRPRTTVIVTKQRIIPGHYQLVWVEPVYEYRRTPCGDLVKVVVREGFYKKVWIPATTSCETGYH